MSDDARRLPRNWAEATDDELDALFPGWRRQIAELTATLCPDVAAEAAPEVLVSVVTGKERI